MNAPFVFQSRRGTELTAVGAVLAGALSTCAWFSVGMILAQRAVESAAAGAVGEEIIGEGSATGAGRTTIADLRERALGESFLAALAALAVAAVLFIAPWGALVRQPQKAPPRGALRAAARRRARVVGEPSGSSATPAGVHAAILPTAPRSRARRAGVPRGHDGFLPHGPGGVARVRAA